MAAVLSSEAKYSLKYTVSVDSTSPVSRTFSGMNIADSSGSQSSGPTWDNAVNSLLNTLSAFTNGTIGNVKWTTEREVDW